MGSRIALLPHEDRTKKTSMRERERERESAVEANDHCIVNGIGKVIRQDTRTLWITLAYSPYRSLNIRRGSLNLSGTYEVPGDYYKF